MSASLLAPEVLLEQFSGGIAAAEPERDRQSQHQRAERDRKCRQHDGRRQAQLLERHDDGDRDDQKAQRATQQARAGQSRIHRCEQRRPPEKVADQKSEREDQQRDQEAGHESERIPRPAPETARTAAYPPPRR